MTDKYYLINKNSPIKNGESISFWGYYKNNRVIKSKWKGTLGTKSHDEYCNNYLELLKVMSGKKKCSIVKTNLKSVIIKCAKNEYLWKISTKGYSINNVAGE